MASMQLWVAMWTRSFPPDLNKLLRVSAVRTCCCYNTCPFTTSSGLSDPVPAWSCCLNYLCACTAQNDFNITVRPIRATGPYLVSLDNLVFSDRIDEPDEGFILYLEVDTERTTLDSSSVIVINNNATLVIIQNGKCMHFLYMLGMV